MQGGKPCIAFQLPLCSGGGFARTMAKRQRGADGTSASRWRRSRRTGKMAAVKGLRVEISRREILPALDGRQARAEGKTMSFRPRRGEREGGTPSPISASYPCGYSGINRYRSKKEGFFKKIKYL